MIFVLISAAPVIESYYRLPSLRRSFLGLSPSTP